MNGWLQQLVNTLAKTEGGSAAGSVLRRGALAEDQESLLRSTCLCANMHVGIALRAAFQTNRKGNKSFNLCEDD